jgi:HAD superfamily hydrolase (TIGR01509 family)
MSLGAVLIDLDGTLVDRAALFTAWATRFVSERSLDPGAVERIIDIDQRGQRARLDLFERLVGALELDEDPGELLEAYYEDFPSSFVLDERVQSALRALRGAGASLAVVTNGPPTQRTKLIVTGLIDELDAVCISSEVGSTKPDREIFLEALRRLDRPARGAWMVGDDPIADIAGGRRAALHTAWVAEGRTWDGAHVAPDRTVESFVEFADWLLEEPSGAEVS